jgi:hypothetical protein
LVTQFCANQKRPQSSEKASLTYRLRRPLITLGGVRVLFTGSWHQREFARGLGEFIAEPVNATHDGTLIEWLTGA